MQSNILAYIKLIWDKKEVIILIKDKSNPIIHIQIIETYFSLLIKITFGSPDIYR